MTTVAGDKIKLVKQAATFALALAIWFSPIPTGLTSQAWHLFAIFSAAIFAVIINAFPLLTGAMLAVAAAVLTHTVDPAKAFAGFAECKRPSCCCSLRGSQRRGQIWFRPSN